MSAVCDRKTRCFLITSENGPLIRLSYVLIQISRSNFNYLSLSWEINIATHIILVDLIPTELLLKPKWWNSVPSIYKWFFLARVQIFSKFNQQKLFTNNFHETILSKWLNFQAIFNTVRLLYDKFKFGRFSALHFERKFKHTDTQNGAFIKAFFLVNKKPMSRLLSKSIVETTNPSIKYRR